MTIHLSHALDAGPARKIRSRRFMAIVLAAAALIGTVLVLAPAPPH